MGKIKYFEDVADNEQLPSFQQTITRTHIVKYAGAGGDFNPMHHDEELAKAMGLPSVFAMGLMHGGMLARVITDWAGDGCVKRYKIKFSGMVWPHDVLTFSGSVIRKYQENQANLVDCQLSVVNQKGETAIAGEATTVLPSRK
jgi:acyl dehydratase